MFLVYRHMTGALNIKMLTDTVCIAVGMLTGELDFVMCITWHLPGLNSISQVSSHSCNVSRSAWSVFASSCEFTSLNIFYCQIIIQQWGWVYNNLAIKYVSLLSSRLQYRRRKALPVIGCFEAGHLCAQEKERSKGRTMWHTRCHWYLRGTLPLQHHDMGSTQKKSSDPIQCISFDPMLGEFEK